MTLFGGDFGISDFIFQRLNSFKDHLSRATQRRVANFIEETVIFFSIAGPVMTIPQIVKIYSEKTAAGLSVFTWSALSFSCVFLAHIRGLHQKQAYCVRQHDMDIYAHINYTGIYLCG